ncbi:PEP-utilizing enzyme [Prodigiosinella aquatilis]|nr:PEP-utilizing enzyme [Prodigiosinella sp. LS101]WJV54875.1 PEP-utilizing enzyme [Prodigiosinella sp. LS101]WJV59238.1 PEP-utilizing enzyme [Pectobacteriaceae bacterium C111]
MKLEFKTKSDTLEQLHGKLKTGIVLPVFSFTVTEWVDNHEGIVREIMTSDMLTADIIIRSSCGLEDSSNGSGAGAFHSEKCVRSEKVVISTVSAVIKSYGRIDPSDKVLVQPFLKKTQMSGVAFNRDPRTGSHYDVINYTLSDDTSLVTSGRGSNLHTYISAGNADINHGLLTRVISLLRELESFCDKQAIDIEFAISSSGELVLLQVRPFIASPVTELDADSHQKLVSQIRNATSEFLAPDSRLSGQQGMLGIMPDWNPAEIVGVRPRKLALSLYRFLITDSVWATERRKYGYRDTRYIPLIVSLHGIPYVDVRASFNSLVPADLSQEVCERFVSSCLKRLEANPHLHDKVEFEVIPTCFTFDIDKKLEKLEGLSDNDRTSVKSALLSLTQSYLYGSGRKRIAADQTKLNKLINLQKESELSSVSDIARIYQMLAECKKYGTAPFAALARSAFIGMDILRSAVSEGIISEGTYINFMASLRAPASRLLEDLPRLERDEFLKIYGHLRPGTYDIRVPSYAQDPERYLSSEWPFAKRRTGWHLDPDEERVLETALEKVGLNLSAYALMEFIQQSIVAREEAKFIFSRSVSKVLDIIKEMGSKLGFDADALSHADIIDIIESRTNSSGLKKTLEHSVSRGRESYRETHALTLPPLIADKEEVTAFHIPAARPNFITRKIAEGNVKQSDQANLKGAIVVIPNADPGFDWLFSQDIGALITAYGGSNSHMAIRAAELEVPAIIGAGEALFNTWSSARKLRLDCSVERVEVIE